MIASTIRLRPGIATLRAGMVALALAAGAIRAEAATPPLPAPIVKTLGNGMRVAVFSNSRLPLVQLQLLVPAGVTSEPKGEEGIAYLAVEMLRHGSTSRDPQEFTAEVARTGGSIGSSLGRDYATVSGMFLARDFETGIELLSDGVTYPVFDPLELKRVQSQALRQQFQRMQNAGAAADDQIWQLVFGDHPYGRPASGLWGPVAGLDAGRVREFWAEHYHPDRAVLAIAGDVTPERAFAAAEAWFGRWGGHATATPAPPAPKPARGVRIRIVDRPGAGTELRLGAATPASGGADELALLAAGALLGGAPARRPAGERTLYGYELRTGYIALAAAGLFTVGCTVASDSVGNAVRALSGDLGDLGQPAGPDDVAGVKRLIKNTFPMAFETLDSWTSSWLAADFHGLGAEFFERYPERVDALTGAGIAAAAQRWLAPSQLAIVAVGPARQLVPQLEKFGKVEVVRSDTSARAKAAAPPGPGAAAAVRGSAPTAAQRARGRQLIALAIAAHGGLAKLRSIKDSRVEAIATIEMNGQKLEGNMVQARREPDRMVFITEFGGIATRQTLNGGEGWQLAGAESVATAMDPENLDALKSGFGSDLHHLLLAAADPKALVWARGTQKLDTLTALVVVVAAPGQAERTYYLHPRTHRLIAFDQGESGPQQGFLARRKFSDFQPVGGILWPYHEDRLLDGETVMRVDVRNVRFNSGVPDAAFEMPSTGPKPSR